MKLLIFSCLIAVALAGDRGRYLWLFSRHFAIFSDFSVFDWVFFVFLPSLAASCQTNVEGYYLDPDNPDHYIVPVGADFIASFSFFSDSGKNVGSESRECKYFPPLQTQTSVALVMFVECQNERGRYFHTPSLFFFILTSSKINDIDMVSA